MNDLDLEGRLRSLRDEPDDVPAGLADRALRQAHRRRTRRRALAVAGTAMAAAVLVAGVNATTSTLSNRAPASGSTPLLPRENVLIIGSDETPNRTGVRPDTIVLASIDTRTGRTTLFGFPRNLGHVPFPPGSAAADRFPEGFFCVNATTGLNDCMLNAVWTWAESPEGRQAYPVEQPGLTATRDVVEQISGLPVTQTVVVTMKGLQNLVDAVGGVTVRVTERLPIGGDSEQPVATGGWIEPGVRKLDGYHALWYSRSRWSTSDYDRMRRQQCLLAALAQQTDAQTLAVHWPRIAKAVREGVRTSFDLSDLQLWVKVADGIRAGEVRMFPFTDQVIPDRDNPDYPRIRSLVAEAVAPKATGAGGAAGPARATEGSSC